MALIRLTQVNGRFIRETPSSRHRTQRCPTTPEPPPHVPPTQAKQPSRRALYRISNFTSAPPPFAAIPARPFLAPFAADPPDLRPTTPRSESLARNRATLRYVRELRPARPIVRPRNSRTTDGFWRVLRTDALFCAYRLDKVPNSIIQSGGISTGRHIRHRFLAHMHGRSASSFPLNFHSKSECEADCSPSMKDPV